MPKITGNKGEWSEAYVLLKLLGDGRLFAADDNLKKIENVYFPIIKIIREEIKRIRQEYSISQDGLVKVYINEKLFKSMSQSDFIKEADFLYDKICNGGSAAFSVEHTENFLNEIGCHRLAAPSTDKTDILMQIHDVQTGYEPICGFSIKSEIGNPPTLLNATKATNFIFQIKGISHTRADEINSINSSNKIKERMDIIFREADDIAFKYVANKTFEQNLTFIDTKFPEILAWVLIYHYRDGIVSCSDIIKKLESLNPLRFTRPGIYTYKFKKFLCSVALGMKPASGWNGRDEANGGYIIVTSSGDVLAYHIYNRDYFEDYLLNNTKLERGSTSRHDFAYLYMNNEEMLLNLNLQIRFK